MKVVTTEEMTRIEKLAYQQGSSEDVFMEKAGQMIAEVTDCFANDLQIEKRLLALTAKGNNSGDAYVAARYLLAKGWQVYVLQLAATTEYSPLCLKNYERYIQVGGQCIQHLQEEMIPQFTVILDGLFGTGFKGSLENQYASVVESVNRAHLPIVAIDIPSGLHGTTGEVKGLAIQANLTIALGLPKIGYFMGDGWNHVGEIVPVDIGIPDSCMQQIEAVANLPSKKEISSLLPQIKRNRHKYQAGLVAALAGSSGMPGAAMLSSLAALRGGAGMVKLFHPEGMEGELAAAPYELVRVAYDRIDMKKINEAGAVFIGPGIGRSERAKQLLKDVLKDIQKPLVMDADALTLLAEHSLSIPKETVLTPHLGELSKLLHVPSPATLDVAFLKRCQQFAEEKAITLLLKGGPSWIFHPGQPVSLNLPGSPGMATAGSGDVLAGLITALISQGLTPYHATLFAVYLHGIAGELAGAKESPYAMIASDILTYLGAAWWELLEA